MLAGGAGMDGCTMLGAGHSCPIFLYVLETLMPIRLSTDTFIYKRLTKFQKENTYVLYDKRTPSKTPGYILFIPPVKDRVAEGRIWSWTLEFKFGKYMFKSVTGEEGYEYIFSPEVFKGR